MKKKLLNANILPSQRWLSFGVSCREVYSEAKYNHIHIFYMRIYLYIVLLSPSVILSHSIKKNLKSATVHRFMLKKFGFTFFTIHRFQHRFRFLNAN